jgi:hypothetical protein
MYEVTLKIGFDEPKFLFDAYSCAVDFVEIALEASAENITVSIRKVEV